MQSTVIEFDTPRDEIILVMLASDHWAYSNGLSSETYNIFDYVKLESINSLLVNIDIVGPNRVGDQSSTQYEAFAIYDDGSEEDISDECLWTANESKFAEIDANGLLTTNYAYKPSQSINIYAEYITDDNEILTADKEVAILPMCSNDGYALSFDGVDDYVKAPTLDIDIVTVSAWVKFHSIQVEASIVCNFGNGGYGLNSFENNPKMQFGVHINNRYRVIYANEDFDLEKWYYVVGTYDGTNGYLYIDGVKQQDSFSVTGNITDTGVPMTIGANPDDYRGFPERNKSFNGLIDKVAIFNRALSAEEIKQNMLNKLSGNEDGLVGYWNFDEGNGDIAYDSSGNGNDGTLYNEPNWVEHYMPIICTTPGLITRNLEKAIGIKENINAELKYAIEIENATRQMFPKRRITRGRRFSRAYSYFRAELYVRVAILREYVSRRYINYLNIAVDIIEKQQVAAE